MNYLKLVVIAVFMTISQASFAAIPTPTNRSVMWELTGATNASFTLSGTTPTTWAYGVSGKLGYTLSHGMQVVLGPTLSHAYAGGTWTFGMSAIAGVRLNSSFSDDIKNDFFVFLGARIGNIPGVVTTAAGGTTYATITGHFEAEFGKRFAIIDGVSYAPSVIFDAGDPVAFSVVPLQFSLLF